MASTIKVDNVQNQPGTNIINKCGTDVTLGASGDTVALASGASQTGFGRTGTVDWVTTPKVTGDSPVTAATGSGYFLNTTAGTITINLPAGAAGSIVSMADYAATWQTNNVTVAANGSEKIGGVAEDATLDTEGQSVTFVYVDSTQGWVNTMDSTSNVRGVPPYIVATGGTPCSGAIVCTDYKQHTFTGPGTFTVCNVAACAADNAVAYMVVAGGGGGGDSSGNTSNGGGGAGGFREGTTAPIVPYTASPLVAATGITVTATGYPISVGGGGPPSGGGSPDNTGGSGSVSSFSTIPSAGGGGGGGHSPGAPGAGAAGGSGGGGGPDVPRAGGAGNTPPVSPAQGTAGSAGNGPGPGYGGGGGGGATVAGGSSSSTAGGPGGNGATTSINATPTTYSGGGGGAVTDPANSGNVGTGGSGGGGRGAYDPGAAAIAGTVNTGGAGGGANGPGTSRGGGSGIVIIRYKFQ